MNGTNPCWVSWRLLKFITTMKLKIMDNSQKYQIPIMKFITHGPQKQFELVKITTG
jgi:hypothetical protein